MMIFVILMPIILAMVIPMIPDKNRKLMMGYTEAVVILTSCLVLYLLSRGLTEPVTILHLSETLTITLKIDGMGRLYAGLVSILWPFATLYAFDYMEHEERQKWFFMFYTGTFGVTLGVCFAANIVTMYLFFEFLSLITLPLVMHTMTKEALAASRTYLYYMFGGAALGFMGMIFILKAGTTDAFVYGGVLGNSSAVDPKLMMAMYVCCFLGFGVKTAVFPFSSWLPKAGVAPTPVTALLHAVAVVNTGAFAVARVTYFSFDPELLRGSFAQTVALILTIITIVYGCSRAVKERHFKRRLAWSTVSNLSYMLFGIALMTPLGLAGGLLHMVMHSFMKIALFFVAGAVNEKTGRHYTFELDGLGRRMPLLFAVFTISGLALMGLPGLCGFISKWYLAKAAVETGTVLGYVGVGALLISALLTAIYIMTIVVAAYFPEKDFDDSKIASLKDPGWMMMVPLAFFIVMIFVLGVHSQSVVSLIMNIVYPM